MGTYDLNIDADDITVHASGGRLAPASTMTINSADLWIYEQEATAK